MWHDICYESYTMRDDADCQAACSSCQLVQVAGRWDARGAREQAWVEAGSRWQGCGEFWPCQLHIRRVKGVSVLRRAGEQFLRHPLGAVKDNRVGMTLLFCAWDSERDSAPASFSPHNLKVQTTQLNSTRSLLLTTLHNHLRPCLKPAISPRIKLHLGFATSYLSLF